MGPGDFLPRHHRGPTGGCWRTAPVTYFHWPTRRRGPAPGARLHRGGRRAHGQTDEGHRRGGDPSAINEPARKRVAKPQLTRSVTLRTGVGRVPRLHPGQAKAGAPAKGGFRKDALQAASSHQLGHPKTLSSVSFSASGSPVRGAHARLPGVQARDATNPGPRRGRDPKECRENMIKMRPEDSHSWRGARGSGGEVCASFDTCSTITPTLPCHFRLSELKRPAWPRAAR